MVMRLKRLVWLVLLWCRSCSGLAAVTMTTTTTTRGGGRRCGGHRCLKTEWNVREGVMECGPGGCMT